MVRLVGARDLPAKLPVPVGSAANAAKRADESQRSSPVDQSVPEAAGRQTSNWSSASARPRPIERVKEGFATRDWKGCEPHRVVAHELTLGPRCSARSDRIPAFTTVDGWVAKPSSDRSCPERRCATATRAACSEPTHEAHRDRSDPSSNRTGRNRRTPVTDVSADPVRLADQELTDFIASFNKSAPPPAAQAGAIALRKATAERTATRPRGPELHRVDDVDVAADGPLVRVYRPTADASGVLAYFHGGGWVIGDLDSHDRACRRLAAASGVVVVSVDYRRAPEHPWPAAIDDAIRVVRWVSRTPDELGGPVGRVGVGGDSAGGTIAALTSQRLRDESPELLPAAQFLLYANTDLTNSGHSMTTKGHGFGLDVADIEWFNAQWVPDRSMWTNPNVSPLFCEDLAGLPPTFVVTCEHDPLRDQAEEYARHLSAAGVPTVARREPGMVHNFMLWDLVSPACAAAAERVAHDIASALAA